MRRALELAALGRGDVEPNPRVGAVCLRDGRIVGEGFHRAYGEPHAEREALADANRRGESVDTVCVTLEPCSTKKGTAGKQTPACTEGLLEAGVKRCVIAAVDPDPRHGGPGVKTLRAAGVEVIEGVLSDEAEALNRPFARWLRAGTPWTIAKVAQSLDGKIATRKGHSRWISGEESRLDAHRLRARCDAVVVGYRTALVDDPKLTVRLPDGDPLAGRQPLRIVVDPRAELPVTLHLFAEARSVPTLAIVREGIGNDHLTALRSRGVEVLPVPESDGRGLDFRSAWRALRERGLKRVMVEGGGGLFASLLEADRIDQWRSYIAPRLIGGLEAPTALGGLGAEEVDDGPTFDEISSRSIGSDLRLDAFRCADV